jgi:hypothetical protein
MGMHRYSFDPYFMNIRIQTMCNSFFERETHHASSDEKLEKFISCEQFCGWSKTGHVLVRTKNFITDNLIQLVSLNRFDSGSV